MPSRKAARFNEARIDAGYRNKRITVQRLTESKGDAGEPVEDWDTLEPLELDASKVDVGGYEAFGTNQLTARFDTVWGIEYREDMDPDLLSVAKLRRVLYQNRAYDIVEAYPVGHNKEGIELRTLARRG